MTTAVDGAAARAIGALARDRWFSANGWRPEEARPGADCWPDGLKPTFRDVEIGVARTQPSYRHQPEVREIEALYLAAIASARRIIYLESQYFSAHRICEALEQRLAEHDSPEVIIINPRRAHGWLEEKAMGSARAHLHERLRSADRFNRLRFCTPVTDQGLDIYVHAKVVVIDDTLLRIGSSNINNRSMGLDTECDLALEVRPDKPDAPDVRDAIARTRDTLLAEHLGVTQKEWTHAVRAAEGSIVGALDRLIRSTGPTLLPFEPPQLSDAERRLAETHVLHPHRPEAMTRTFVRTLQQVVPRKAGAAIMLASAAGGLFAWLRLNRKTLRPD